MIDLQRWRAVARLAFMTYAIALAVATHWPGLAVASPGGLRLDLFIHAGAFGMWTMLLSETGWTGRRRTRRNAALACVVGLIYAIVDELTQGIPIVNRVVDPRDLAANAAGVLVIGAWLWWRAAPHDSGGHLP